MPRFKDMIGGWSEGFPEDALDLLNAAYDDDLAEALAEANGVAAAKIDGLAADILSRDQQINELKAANWDLSQLVPLDTNTPEDEGEPDEDSPSGLAGFFTDEEEDE